MNIEKIIKEKQGTIVDVRTPAEFQGGNVPSSVNIPLQEIPQRLEEISKLQQPLVLCCASGGRSGLAKDYLSQKGINCVNGGSWLDVNHVYASVI